MDQRLSLDLGANSIGWCLYDLDGAGRPCRIRDIGVRIFPDGRNPKDGTSLATMRRRPRQMRRRRDRYLRRRRRLMDALVRHGLMPEDESARKKLLDEPAVNKRGKAVRRTVDPYELRARGLDEPLAPYELARALFHLNQRRGFKSNRRTDKADDGDDKGKIKAAAGKLETAMQEVHARTLGEYLHMRRQGKVGGTPLPVRARLNGVGAKAEYELYPTRDMIAAEFDKLWAAQAKHDPDLLTEAARNELRDILLYQRPLKPVDPGRCTFNPDEERAPWALPSAQRSRIYRELGNLEKIDPVSQRTIRLTKDERDIVAGQLFRKEKLTFKGMRRLLKLDSGWRFNLESEKRDHLDGDKTAHRLAHDKLFGPRWHDLPVTEQDAIVETLIEEQDEEAVIAWLTNGYGLSRDAAERVNNCKLPSGHGNIGRTALAKINAEFEADNVTYAEACQRAGFHHSDLRTGEVFDRLPYYGKMLERHVGFGTGNPSDRREKRFGRVANPTVHIGLNQIRRVANALVRRYGPPKEIVIEIGRELKQSYRQRQRIQDEQAENQRRNDKRREKLAEQGLEDSGEARMRLRLWEELNPEDPANRRCIYTGESISIRRLFSDEVEIDHILPFSRTLDNSASNRIVSLRKANRVKADRSPYEARADFERQLGIDWDGVMERAQVLPARKRWRFGPDAMEKYENEEQDFLDRHLQETQYLSRLAKAYLGGLCGDDNVWVSPGRLTAMLRGLWGLNAILSDHNLKERVDHRHHAIDAAVVGVTDRALLKRVATAAGRAEREGAERLLKEVPEPWDGFREELREKIGRVVVSHKPDHGVHGPLHNDTAYGIVRPEESGNGSVVAHRVPVSSFKSAKDIERVRDPDLRKEMLAVAEGKSGTALRDALAEWAKTARPNGPIRRVRVIEKIAVIPIQDRSGRVYKAYKGDSNAFVDICLAPNGRWVSDIVSTFEANRPDFDPEAKQARNGLPLVMRLFKNDVLAVPDGDGQRYLRVVKFTSGRLYLADHNEGGNLKARDAASNDADPFKYVNVSAFRLQKLGARKVRVDELGRVFAEERSR